MNFRPDYDPTSKVSFLETTTDVKAKQEPMFNAKTNFYDYLRVASTEASNPEPRGYIDIPISEGRVTSYDTPAQRQLEEKRIRERANALKFTLPLLSNGKPVSLNGEVQTKLYTYGEISKSDDLMKYLFRFFSSIQGTVISSKSEYRFIMAELNRRQARPTGTQLPTAQPPIPIPIPIPEAEPGIPSRMPTPMPSEETPQTTEFEDPFEDFYDTLGEETERPEFKSSKEFYEKMVKPNKKQWEEFMRTRGKRKKPTEKKK